MESSALVQQRHEVSEEAISQGISSLASNGTPITRASKLSVAIDNQTSVELTIKAYNRDFIDFVDEEDEEIEHDEDLQFIEFLLATWTVPANTAGVVYVENLGRAPFGAGLTVTSEDDCGEDESWGYVIREA